MKLVEILFEEPRGQINIYKNRQKKEMAQGLHSGIESIQNIQSDQATNRQPQIYIGDSNINLNPAGADANMVNSSMAQSVKFKIDAYQNKIDKQVINKKPSFLDKFSQSTRIN